MQSGKHKLRCGIRHVASQLLANFAPPAYGQPIQKKLYVLSVLALDELGMCGESVVFPEHPVPCTPRQPINTTVLTVTSCNIVENGPRATRFAGPFDFTKQKLLRQSTIRHPESMTKPPESFALQLRLHLQGIAQLMILCTHLTVY